MDKIFTIKKGGDNLYPRTTAEAIAPIDGKTLPAIAADVEKSLGTQTSTPAIGESNGWGVWGVVSHTLTHVLQSDGSYVSEVSAPVWGWIPREKVHAYTLYGATFNTTTGYFELNEITNLSYNEMLKIEQIPPFDNTLFTMFKPYVSAICRTNFYRNYNASWESGAGAFGYGAHFETIRVAENTTMNSNFSYFLAQCFYLKKVIGKFKFVGPRTVDTSTFNACYSLEEVYIGALQSSIRFTASSRLSNASILYMVANASNGSTNITITLHATAYARAIADADIQAALTANGHITLASA